MKPDTIAPIHARCKSASRIPSPEASSTSTYTHLCKEDASHIGTTAHVCICGRTWGRKDKQ